MKKRKYSSLLLASFFCCSCSSLASWQVFVGCQAADMITTARALRMNKNAYETNPIPIPILFTVKISLSAYVANIGDNWNKSEETEGLRIIANAISCAPVPGNLKAAKGD